MNNQPYMQFYKYLIYKALLSYLYYCGYDNINYQNIKEKINSFLKSIEQELE